MIAPAAAPMVNLLRLRRMSHYYYVHPDGRRWDAIWRRSRKGWILIGPEGDEGFVDGPLDAARVRIYNEAHA